MGQYYSGAGRTIGDLHFALVNSKPRNRRFTTGNERFYAKLRSFEIENIDTIHLALHVSS
jgi:hypothetical protein